MNLCAATNQRNAIFPPETSLVEMFASINLTQPRTFPSSSSAFHPEYLSQNGSYVGLKSDEDLD